MAKEPNPSPRERQMETVRYVNGKIIGFGTTPKPANIRKPRVLPPRPPKKS